MRPLLLVAALAALVVVGGGQLVEARAESAVAARAADEVSHLGSVDVAFVGGPAVVHVARGRIPSVTITLTDLEVGAPPLTLERLVVDLRDVRYDPIGLVVDAPPTLHIGSGSVRAEVAPDELARLVERDRPGWDVRVPGDRILATSTIDGRAVRVGATVELADGRLRVRTSHVSAGAGGSVPHARAIARMFDLSTPAPALPAGLTLTSATVDEAGRLVLEGPAPAELLGAR